MNHHGSHRCTDPRCRGYDRKRIFRNIDKQGAVVVTVHDATPAFAYTIGLFAHHTLPELMMMYPTLSRADELQAALFLFTVADYLATLRTVDVGTFIPAAVVGGGFDLWLWDQDARNRTRDNMGIARHYYRDKHMRRLEDVPVFLVSPNPHPAARSERADLYTGPRAGGIVERMLAEARAATGETSL